MLILIAIVPGYFTINQQLPYADVKENIHAFSQTYTKINPVDLKEDDLHAYNQVGYHILRLDSILNNRNNLENLSLEEKAAVRKDILIASKASKTLLASKNLNLSVSNKEALKSSLSKVKSLTEYAPFWVILLISISLGVGTMVGWKRIVTTIGEKIGKQHLTYAQGASAELVAVSTIGFSTWLGLPVSTTHVLSSGIAGSMVASKGIKNLQTKTIKSIAIAWLLTLPVSMVVSGGLFILFRMLL